MNNIKCSAEVFSWKLKIVK